MSDMTWLVSSSRWQPAHTCGAATAVRPKLAGEQWGGLCTVRAQRRHALSHALPAARLLPACCPAEHEQAAPALPAPRTCSRCVWWHMACGGPILALTGVTNCRSRTMPT